MKLLVLSFYYQPDLSAGSFRTTALVKALLDKLPADAHIELITTLPNRYSSFSSEAPELEEHPRLTIRRIALPAHKSGMVDQAKAFLVYARHVRNFARGKHYDLVYATSSRLMTATLGAVIARSKKTPLYLDIRDIFVDTIKDVLSGKMVRFIKPILSLLERFTIKSARKVNLVSAGFLPYFKSRYPDQKYSLFTNGIDDEFLNLPIVNTEDNQDRILDVVYAGNFGEGQGLHNIIPQLAKRLEGKVRFKVIGDGGRLAALKDAINASKCNNVDLLSPVKRDELIGVYQSADILFLHLNDYDAFRKVLPSKLFEYAALGKPIWAGIAGYAAEFVTEHIENASVFAPCDVDAAVESFERLTISTTPRAAFIDRFSRANIMRDMAVDVISTSEVS
ncbi:MULTISPECIES: glycosyltransferase family 4 protein [Pseudomonas]|uniref:glycosyltransferase family 4 protein n=1 Tax=Pseudomonas TaxID=286 RepID=UPI000A1D6666|nr:MULTISPECIES: glycosyltransferase family 4 protein [Pseudomonas]PNB81095.1 glycosyltransferase WbuB [Pseudomonas sp. FW305-BF6]MCH4899127.1 glycosyltransferase [Pseudomonas sp. B707]PNA06111.1 glycosyltransferase WbuB [Pseudomonas sp. FW305-BF15]PNB51021.1 glycosyltransferase WbuB [Pseudomonas sp. GW456-12-10-14-LB2]TEA62418.1 glycosyltransferase WbuB [Pseudomonas sp. CH235]